MPNAELKTMEHVSTFRRIAAVAWDPPRDPTIYGSVEIRAERLLEWIDLRRRETGQKITITHAVARAVAITLKKHPDINAFVRWGQLYQRKNVDVFLQVAVQNEDSVGKADLSGHCIRNADQKDIGQVAEELRAAAKKIRKGDDKDFERTKGQAQMLPGLVFRFLLNVIEFLQYTLNIDTGFLGAPRDPFGAAMVTSLGMMGVRTAWAPFFPQARTAFILLVGNVEEKPVVEDGAIVIRKLLALNGTFDHRVVDGYHAALVSKEIVRLLENPSMLEFEGGRAEMLGSADATTDLPTLDLDTAAIDGHVDEISPPQDPTDHAGEIV
ncbi:MAG: hypothetical protein GY913_30855 [Proteobacteria bacterium]|nr:hypothetical protein [Pseudomonadota bacterium]MCP4921317.1 hypothetical protein [Pseudomonadota bacterium]